MKYLLGISLFASASLAIPRERVRMFQSKPNADSVALLSDQQDLSGLSMERLGALASRHLADFGRAFDDNISILASTSARGLDSEPMSDIERNDIDYPLTEVLIPGISKHTYSSKATPTTSSSSSPDLTPTNTTENQSTTSTTLSVSSHAPSGSLPTSETVSLSETSTSAQTETTYTFISSTPSSIHSDPSSEISFSDETSAYSKSISETHTSLPSSSILETTTGSPSISIQTIVSTYTLTVISLATPTTSLAEPSATTTTAQPTYASESSDTSSSAVVLTSTLNSNSETTPVTELKSEDHASSTQVTASTVDSVSPTVTQTYLVIVNPTTNESTYGYTSATSSSILINDSNSITRSDCSKSSSLHTDDSPTDTTIESTSSIAESSSRYTQDNISSNESPSVTPDSSTTHTASALSTSNIAYSEDTTPSYLITTSTLSASCTSLVDSTGPIQSPSETSLAYIDDDPLSTLSLTPESKAYSSTTDLLSSATSSYASTTSIQSSEDKNTQNYKVASVSTVSLETSSSTYLVHPTFNADYTATVSIKLLPIRVSSGSTAKSSRTLDHHKPIYSLPPHPLRNVDHVAKLVQTEQYPSPQPTLAYTSLHTSSHTYHTTSYSSAYEQSTSSYKVSRQHSHDHRHSHGNGRHTHRDHSSSSNAHYPTSTYYFPSDEADGISLAMGFRNKASFISAVRANITPTIDR